MKKYKFIADVLSEKIVVDDLDNDRATIYWHNGKIEKSANCSDRYKTDYYKDSWFDSVDDCCYDRIAIMHCLCDEYDEPYSYVEEEEQVVAYLYNLVKDNPLEEIYKD